MSFRISNSLSGCHWPACIQCCITPGSRITPVRWFWGWLASDGTPALRPILILNRMLPALEMTSSCTRALMPQRRSAVWLFPSGNLRFLRKALQKKGRQTSKDFKGRLNKCPFTFPTYDAISRYIHGTIVTWFLLHECVFDISRLCI